VKSLNVTIEEILSAIQAAAQARNPEMTLHATQEAYAEQISADEIRQALMNGQILENYPEHRRGPCCLIYGDTDAGRPIHVVCTSYRRPVLIITVYEPRPPRWITPTQRSKSL
jgi:hypothetical protein